MKKIILLAITFSVLFSGCALVLGADSKNKYQEKRDEIRMKPAEKAVNQLL